MHVHKLFLRIILFFIVMHASALPAFNQDISWMKGLWKEARGTPFFVPPVKCINTLEITAVADSSFSGLQTTRFAADSNVQITYACAGYFTQHTAQFSREKLFAKKNSPLAGYEWNTCAVCTTRSCNLMIEDKKIVLQITTTDCDSACNGTIAYYRALAEFDSSTQHQLLTLYQKPQQYSSILITHSSTQTINNYATEKNTTYKIDSAKTDLLSNEDALPTVLKERTNKLAQTLQITSPAIEVILLDDAEIDGDIVSLYYNNKEVIDHKTLGKEVIKYSFKADKQHKLHEIILVAENLGSIPPNTALMRIRAGDKKYELTTRANMHENAKVIIEYAGE